MMLRTVLIGLALAVLCAVLDATADDQLRWYGYGRGGEVHLLMGMPETDNQIIDISCARGSDAIRLRSPIGSDGLKAGDPAELALANGRTTAVFKGRAVADGKTAGIEVEATGRLGAFLAVAEAGRPFLLEARGARYGLDPDRIEKPLAALTSACRAG